MQLESHIQAIQQELAATAALGDEAAAESARRMGEALAATLHLHLLDLLGEAALEITGQIEPARVEVRLAGRDPELVVVVDEAASTEPVGFGEESSGRITLRLPELAELGVTHPGGRREQGGKVHLLAQAAQGFEVDLGEEVRGPAGLGGHGSVVPSAHGPDCEPRSTCRSPNVERRGRASMAP